MNERAYCIYHSRDLDGWMSAAIVKLINPDIELIGWDYGQSIPEIEEGRAVIMVDISFPMEEMLDIAKKSKWRLTWIDHHSSAIKAYKEFIGQGESFMSSMIDINFAACELTWKYFFKDIQMPELVRLLGRYDCFGHKGTDEERKVLEFQYGARQRIYNVKTAHLNLQTANISSEYDKNTCNGILTEGRAIYDYLCTEAQQIYAMKFNIIIDEYKFACVNYPRFNPINFGINYHEEGYDGFACFHYQNGQFTYSLYNDNGLVDCSLLCKARGGGGHKGAAGFRTNIMVS